jgi:hypothetical protein
MTPLHRFIVKEYDSSKSFAKYLSAGIINEQHVGEILLARYAKITLHSHSHHPGSDGYVNETLELAELKVWQTYLRNNLECVSVKNLSPKFGVRLIVLINAIISDKLYLVDIPAGQWEPYVNQKHNRGELYFSFAKTQRENTFPWRNWAGEIEV